MYKEFLYVLNECLKHTKVTKNGLNYVSLYHLANNHHVSPLVYNCIYENNDIPSELKQVWKKNVLTSVAGQALRSQVFLDVYKDFMKENLRVIVVKGIILRNLYPEPDFRPSNDEDIYVQEKDLKRIIDIFLKYKFVVVNDKDDVVILYDKYSGLCVEIHTSLFDKESEFFNRYQMHFDNVFDNLYEFNINKNVVYSLSHEQHFLFLSFHLIKHILHSGVGIRQIMDLFMYYKEYGKDMDISYIYDVYKKMEIDYVMDNIFSFGKDTFELDDIYLKESYTYINDYEELILDLLESGLYGKTSIERIHSANITVSATSGHNTLKNSLFPPLKTLKSRYTYLNKYPFLLPLAWITRITKYVLDRKSGNKKETIDIGNKRVEMLKKYKVIK